MSRFQARAGERLHWRAIVSTTGVLDAHCPIGADLLRTSGDADGHCLIAGECPRCALLNALIPAVTVPAVPPVATGS